jgi:hypothetical protein
MRQYLFCSGYRYLRLVVADAAVGAAVWGAGGNRQGARLGKAGLSRGGGGIGMSRGECTGKSEDNNERTDDKFHFWLLPFWVTQSGRNKIFFWTHQME